MSVLVTGGAGFIGSHITHKLIQAGYEPIVIDDLSSGFEEAIPKGVPLHRGNIGDSRFLESFFANHKVDSVIHCAASVNVNESVNNPSKYYQNNVAHSIHFLKSCIKAKVKSFLFSSSAAVYGNPEEKVIREITPTSPINPYGESKLMFEKVLHDTSLSLSMNYVILRYFNVAGADTGGQIGQSTKNCCHLIKVACETVCGQREYIKIYGTDYPTYDGTCIRDFIHVEDLAITHILALEYLNQKNPSEVFNCGYGRGFSVRDVLEAVKHVSGVDFNIIEAERRDGDPVQLIADSQKIKQVLGWSPEFNDLHTICRSALNWERKLRTN